MPAHDAARRRLSVAVPAERDGRAVVAAVPAQDAGRLDAALLTWAEADDGALLLLDRGAAGRTAVRWLNAAGARLLGYAPEEAVGQPLERLLRSPFSGPPTGRTASEPLLDGRRVVRRAATVEHRDGTPLRVLVTSVPLADDAAPGWVVRLVLEPDAERVEDELRTSHERFRALADRAPIAIFCSEAGLRLAYLNDRSSELFGAPAARLEGMGWLAHVHLEDRPAVLWAMTRALEGSAQELPLRVAAQRRRPALGARPHRPRAGQPAATPASSARSRTSPSGSAFEASLAHQASRDALTGLLNRRRLLELLERGPRHEPRRRREPPGLLFLDLDDFKQVNDELGHQAGDALLVRGARGGCGRPCARATSSSRFGGDEFAVLCRGLHDEADAADVARRVLEPLSPARSRLGRRRSRVSGSLGVVVAGPSHVEAEDVLRDADTAMYQAKAAGKDRWALFDEQARARARERVELAHDLRRAVEQDQLRGALPAGGAARRPRRAAGARLRRGPRPVDPRAPRPRPADRLHRARRGERPGARSSGCRCCAERAPSWSRGRPSWATTAPRTVSVNVSALQLRARRLRRGGRERCWPRPACRGRRCASS